MKRIIILNGAARPNGNTAALVQAFSEGARGVGHDVQAFRLADMEIRGCKGCLRGGSDPTCPCAQRDDMDAVYGAFANCDLVAFASPIYFWTVSGSLKTATDRLYAELECLGYSGFPRESVLLMTADGSDYRQALSWYQTFERNLGWKNRGEVLGKGRTEAARRLGASI